MEALSLWTVNYRGIVAVVTGAGKTIFALYCMVAARNHWPRCRFLIVVPTIVLADQWRVTLSRELRLTEREVTVLAGGTNPNLDATVVVAVVNSVRDRVKHLTSEGDWCLIVDECHRVASERNRQVLSGRYTATLGLSATPEREHDNWFEQYVVPGLGPVIYRYGYEDAKRDGIISDFDLWNIKVPLTRAEEERIERINRAIAMEAERGGSESERMKRLLIRRSQLSQAAHSRLSTTIALVEQLRGRRGIIFHESIDAAAKIAEVLSKKSHRVRLYHSGLSPIARYESLRLYSLGQVDVLVTCRALDEGFDVPDTEYGILAASTTSTRQRIQRLGRVLRPSTKKERALVVTLYALPSEARLLREEQNRLHGVASTRWFETSRL